MYSLDYYHAMNELDREAEDVLQTIRWVLSRRDYKHILKRYCELEGIEFIFENSSDKEKIDLIRRMNSHLNEIINKSPQLSEPMQVYRGVSSLYFMQDSNDIFVHRGFMSTSLSKKVAEEFYQDGGAIMSIRLPEGTRSIFLRDGEEVVLSNNTKLKLMHTESGVYNFQVL